MTKATADGEAQAANDQFAKDVTDEVLSRFADLVAIPDAARVIFYINVHHQVGFARQIERRVKLKGAADKARNIRIARAVEHLLAELDDVDNDTRAEIERCLSYARPVMGWRSGAAAARPQRLADVIDTLGWVVTAAEPGRRGKKPAKEAFQFLVRFLVRDVRVAGGKLVLKNLMEAIKLLRDFVPAIVPKELPKRTIERAMGPIKRRGAGPGSKNPQTHRLFGGS